MYSIVEFTSTREVDVVPNNWITIGDNASTWSWWPNYRSTDRVRSAMKKCEPPNPTVFSLFAVKPLKSFDKYAEARANLQRSENSDLNSEVEKTPKRDSTIRPRRLCTVKQEADSDSSFSDSESSQPELPTLGLVDHGFSASSATSAVVQAPSVANLPPPPAVTVPPSAEPPPPVSVPHFSASTQLPIISIPTTVPSQGINYFPQPYREIGTWNHDIHFRQNQYDENLPGNSAHIRFCQPTGNPGPSSASRETRSEVRNTGLSGNPVEQPWSAPEQRDILVGVREEADGVEIPFSSSFQKWMVRNMSIMKAQLKQLQESVDVLVHNAGSGATNISTANQNLAGSGVNLPIHNIDDLDQLKDKIKDHSFKAVVTEKLGLSGGNTVGDCTRRVLECLMTNGLAQQMSWLGSRGEKISFADSGLKDLVYDGVRMNKKTSKATTAEIDTTIKDWLKNAKKRLEAQQRKYNIRLEDHEVSAGD